MVHWVTPFLLSSPLFPSRNELGPKGWGTRCMTNREGEGEERERRLISFYETGHYSRVMGKEKKWWKDDSWFVALSMNEGWSLLWKVKVTDAARWWDKGREGRKREKVGESTIFKSNCRIEFKTGRKEAKWVQKWDKSEGNIWFKDGSRVMIVVTTYSFPDTPILALLPLLTTFSPYCHQPSTAFPWYMNKWTVDLL